MNGQLEGRKAAEIKGEEGSRQRNRERERAEGGVSREEHGGGRAEKERGKTGQKHGGRGGKEKKEKEQRQSRQGKREREGHHPGSSHFHWWTSSIQCVCTMPILKKHSVLIYILTMNVTG
jgi:hypothetical protein